MTLRQLLSPQARAALRVPRMLLSVRFGTNSAMTPIRSSPADAHHRELRASLLISLDMQIDLHVVSNDPRSLNHLVPG